MKNGETGSGRSEGGRGPDQRGEEEGEAEVKCGNVWEATDELMLPPPLCDSHLAGVSACYVCVCVCVCVNSCGSALGVSLLDCWETRSLKHR